MDKISEWMDGELSEHETRVQVERIKGHAELRNCWGTFHLIGDVMRGEPALSDEFERKIAKRFAAEATVLAPRTPAIRRFATYTLSAAASLSAVALVGWMAFFNNPLSPAPEATQASLTPPTPAVLPSASEPQLASVPSDGTMNEYLMAHQEFSPSSEIQGVAPYIRSVSRLQQVQGR